MKALRFYENLEILNKNFKIRDVSTIPFNPTAISTDSLKSDEIPAKSLRLDEISEEIQLVL